jgi:hypothetical protein
MRNRPMPPRCVPNQARSVHRHRFRTLAAILATAALAACGVEEAPIDEPTADDPQELAVELGSVDFPTSCSTDAQPSLDHGLLMLHHMMYPQAEASFNEAVRVEDACVMGHWGVAMSRFQPFWGSAELASGREAAQRAAQLEAPTERERLYVQAALAFFEDPDAAYAERIRAWETAMETLHAAYPDDPEAATLFALAHLSTDPGNGDRQARAREIVQEVHREMPQHPGAIHYAIHVHDVDALADDGISFAEAYEELAPTIPHALHMPSHIYVRTGEWDEVVDWNRRSADAALDHPAGEYISLHYAHALDYLMYGYLQQGDDDRAREVRDELLAREGYEPHLASAYAMAAIPARWHVERRDWEGAARVEPRVPEGFAWDEYPAAEAISWYARGLGAARIGDLEGADEAAERLREFENRLDERGQAHWTRQVGVQRRSVEAWQALAEGRADEAVALMREAAAAEDALEKHPITPGELQPAFELLGDLLMELNRPGDALQAYESSLDTWPRRYHTLLGAARAADTMGNEETALAYYRELAELASDAHPDRTGAAEARERIGGS